MSKPTTPIDDAFGEDAPQTPAERSAAEKTMEIERLRKELDTLKSNMALAPVSSGVMPGGDPNESFIGVGRIEMAAGQSTFVADKAGTPIFWYKIDLPPCGGTDIKLCGVAFYHDQQYMVEVDQLRSLREIVARTWGHEQSIRGSNENFYRKPGVYQNTRSNTVRGASR